MDAECLIRNAEILKNQWLYELEETMREVDALIRKEFYTGIWGILFNRIVAEVYNIFLSPDIKDKILRQFDLLILAAKEYNGNADTIVEKYYEEYLTNDPGWGRCKKRHSKSPELRERIKKSFALMLKNTHDLLNSTGECYDDLLFNAYKTKDIAWEATFNLLNDTKESFDFTVKHKLVKINRLIRDQTIRILRREIEVAHEYYEKKLNDIFK